MSAGRFYSGHHPACICWSGDVKYPVKVVKSGETQEMPDPEILFRFRMRYSCALKRSVTVQQKCGDDAEQFLFE